MGKIRVYRIMSARELFVQLGKELGRKKEEAERLNRNKATNPRIISINKEQSFLACEARVLCKKMKEAAKAIAKNGNALVYLDQKNGGPSHWHIVPPKARITNLKTGQTYTRKPASVRTDALHAGRRFVPRKLALYVGKLFGLRKLAL